MQEAPDSGCGPIPREPAARRPGKGPSRRRRFRSREGSVLKLSGLFAGLLGLATLAAPAGAQTSRQVIINGVIDYLTVDDPNDTWSSGTIVVGGTMVTLPRNLILDLPANRLSLAQLFADAPPAALAQHESGLAAGDLSSGGVGGVAQVLANVTPSGNVIAGWVMIEKGQEVVTGNVTYISFRDGFLRVNGIPGNNSTGVMVRINDPSGRFTIQRGAGCNGGPNCSPDVRFGVDSDNYTVGFTTGYPACIASGVPMAFRNGFDPQTDDPRAKANPQGEGDPMCPCTNRETSPVPDSTVFAPILVGDMITAEGNFETVNGVHFLSAHTVKVFESLVTSPDPTQPDYMVWEEVEWDVPGFLNQRQRLLLIGFSTLPDSQLDVFSIHFDPQNNQPHEFIMASTVNNPDTVLQGIGATAGGIFKIKYDIDFVFGLEDAPCANLIAAGYGFACPNFGTIADNMRIINPVPRDIIGRTRHKATLVPGVITRDIHGTEAPNGEYLNPVGLGFPEMGEIDLAAFETPFSFAGVPFMMDRRLSPGGCDGPCEGTRQPLAPFPASGLHPTTQVTMPLSTQNMPLSFFPFGPNDHFGNLVPVPMPPAMPIVPTPIVP